MTTSARVGAAIVLAAVVLVLGGGAVTLAAPASQTAGSVSRTAAHGWRTAATVTQAKGWADITSIAAVSGGDAWASGQTGTSAGKHAPVLEHWAGRSWQQVRLPAKILKTWDSSGLDGGVIAASSASNVWVVGGNTQGVRFARTGKRGWQFGTIPGTAYRKQPLSATIVTTVKVISRTDAWVFGLRLSGSSVTATPFAAQFTGHRWVARRVPGAGAIAAVVVRSARNMLALVGSDEFLGLGTDRPTVVRWNGRKWTALAVQPKPLPGGLPNATSMAVSGGHLWIGGDFDRTAGARSDFVDELTGSAWKFTELPRSASTNQIQLTGLAPDGRGGLWALDVSSDFGVSQRLWHYTGGAWRRPISPRFGGSTGGLVQLAAVPGTDSIWGAGALRRGGLLEGLIAVDGPTPR